MGAAVTESRCRRLALLGLLVTQLLAASSWAQESNPSSAQAAASDATVPDFSAQLDELRKALDAQNALIQQQKTLINSQQKRIEQQQTQLNTQQQQLQTTTDLLKNLQTQIDQKVVDPAEGQLSAEDVEMRQRLAELESQVKKLPEDPASMLIDQNFPGAVRVPGTNAAYKIGGYVKAVVVKNFDPLVTQDRFIVGSIPVSKNDETALASEASLTANQSRVNFDYRQQSSQGDLRAYVEGDFFGSGDTFRLRHAFGQYGDILAGKTWSAFYDADASPEEVDFEGINGHVVLRQTQLRWFPEVGKDRRLMVSLEDPSPKVTGGTGVSDIPDLVISIRRNWFRRWHAKTALLLREIRAINNTGTDINGQSCVPAADTLPGNSDPAGCVAIANAGSKESEFGWAVTASGKIKAPWWNANDNILFQVNYGKGLGRYLTDLSSIQSLGIDGGQDGFVDPVTGDLKALPVFGAYAAFQHWWDTNVRSTFIYSMVYIDNLDSQPNTAYHQTRRASANVIWSPIPNVDLGAEFLWGRRKNKGPDPADGASTGDALQLQLEAIYRF